MRGKSLTCRLRALINSRFPTVAAVIDRKILQDSSRQVEDLPRIGVAEP